MLFMITSKKGYNINAMIPIHLNTWLLTKLGMELICSISNIKCTYMNTIIPSTRFLAEDGQAIMYSHDDVEFRIISL